jgi:hypothetical protein
VSGFGQPRNPSEYTAEELAEVRSTAKLAPGLLLKFNELRSTLSNAFIDAFVRCGCLE